MDFRALVSRHFALGVWILLLVLSTRQVFVHGTDVPFGDDLILVQKLRPEAPVDVAELWKPLHENRIPLAKLAWLETVGTLSDARAGTFVTVILMAASAGMCMWTARRLRGRAHFTDAFFPLVLMHGGQSENVLSSLGLSASILALVIVLGLFLIGTSDERPGPWRIAAIGCVALSLPLMGGLGLPHAAAWIGWLLFVFQSARRSHLALERWTGRTALAFALAAASLTIWYFVDYHLPKGFKAPAPALLGETALQFLSRGMGEPAVSLRPFGSWAVVALLVWTLLVLAWIGLESDTHQARAIGITVVIAGMIGSALAVGYGRAMERDGAGLFEGYGLVAAPLWCAFGLAAALAWERRAGRVLAFLLFAVAAASFAPNFRAGERAGSARRAQAEALEADLTAGMSIEAVAAKRWQDFSTSAELLASALHDLEAVRMKPFRVDAPAARPKPPYEALWTVPRPTLAADAVQSGEAGGRRVLLVRDGAVLEFALGPRAEGVSGTLGMEPRTDATGVTPSATFTIELRRADGTRKVLFEYTVDPSTSAQTGFENTFDVALDATAANGTLALFIAHAGEPKPAWAGYWRDVLVR